MPARSFADYSKEIVLEFLQSVVVVDDEPTFDPRPAAKVLERIPKGPGDPATATQGAADAAVQLAGEISGQNSGLAESLSLQPLTTAFTGRGLLCSIIKPVRNATQRDIGNALSAARRADVLVLDWEIYKDDGATAKAIITGVIGADGQKAIPLRLICIYTGYTRTADELKLVTDEIAKEVEKICGVPARRDPATATLDFGAMRVFVVVKSHITTVQNAHLQVPEAELPDRIITEYTKLTEGLVSNVALKALASVRQNTHRVLRTLSRDLDPAFINHRVHIDYPDDAGDDLVGLIGSELKSLIESDGITAVVGMNVIEMWLKDKQDSEGQFELTRYTDKGKPENVKLTTFEVTQLIKEGAKTFPHKNKITAKSFKTLAATFSEPGNSGEQADCAFAALNSMVTPYHDTLPPRTLTLGTVVVRQVPDKDTNLKNEYLLCVRPRCNSVRLKARTTFPFLRLELRSAGSKFNAIVKDASGSYLKLFVPKALSEITTIDFMPDANTERVLPTEGTEPAAYLSAKNDNDTHDGLIWLGQMKPEHAIRVAGTLAAELSRVGLNESEWLRRSGE